jgi:hypothetical protein
MLKMNTEFKKISVKTRNAMDVLSSAVIVILLVNVWGRYSMIRFVLIYMCEI